MAAAGEAQAVRASFIVPLHNCLAETRECLRSLQATLPPDLDHEVILVDDASTDGTRDCLAAPSGLAAACRVLLNETNLGFASTCNRGAAASNGEVLFFLNNDLILLPGWFEPMFELSLLSGAGLVGNIQRNAATGAIDHTGVHFNHKGKPEHLVDRPLLARLTGRRVVDAVTGACCAIRAETWRLLGGFDEGFVNGGEDVDLCLRALNRGLQTRVAFRSTVRHHVSRSPGRKLRDEQNSRRLLQRWRPEIARLAARDWCRHFIETHWDRSCVFDDMLGRAALYYAAGMIASPPPNVLDGVQASFGIEFARWDRILGKDVHR